MQNPREKKGGGLNQSLANEGAKFNLSGGGTSGRQGAQKKSASSNAKLML
jgi:hypothetical protein